MEALRREIDSAFAERAHPGDERIALHRDDCPGYEGNDVARFFRGKDWREVTWESIVSDPNLDPNAFSFFFTPEGFVYYLPALLKLALDLDTSLQPAESLCFALKPPGDWAGEEVTKQLEHKLELLTPTEKRAVVDVLEYLAEEWDRRSYVGNQAREALDALWIDLAREASSGSNEPEPVRRRDGTGEAS